MNRCWPWPCAAWIEALRTATSTNVLSCIVSFRWGREGWVTIRCSTRPVYSPARHSDYSGGVAQGTIGGCDIPELRFCWVHSLDAYRVNGDWLATSVGDRFCTFWLPVGRVSNATSAGTTPQCLSGHVMFRFNFRLFVSTPGSQVCATRRVLAVLCRPELHCTYLGHLHGRCTRFMITRIIGTSLCVHFEPGCGWANRILLDRKPPRTYFRLRYMVLPPHRNPT